MPNPRRDHHASRERARQWIVLACAICSLAAPGIVRGQAPSATPAAPQSAAAATKPGSKPFVYPIAPQSNQLDDYHGRQVADPYRPLEDPDSAVTRRWIEAENELTFSFLRTIPAREPIRARLTQLWNYEKFGIPQQRGGRYFYSRNDGLQNQSVIYVAPALDAAPEVLLDPNALSADGTVALSGYAISDDGRLFAYGLATAGSDWQQWRVRDVASKRDLDDRLDWVKFSGASWTPDNQGFFYSRYDEPAEAERLTGVNYYQKLYYHRVGQPQSADRLVYERKDEKEWSFAGTVSDDGRYLVISVGRGTERKNQLFYLDLTRPDAEVVPWITGFDAEYDFVGNDGSTFWLRTDLDAPRHRLIAADVARPAHDGWRELIPQSADVLQHVSAVGGRFVALYLKDAASRVRVFDLTGAAAGTVELPDLGTAALGAARQSDRELFYSFTGFLAAPTIYRYDVAAGQSSVFRQPRVDFAAENYVTEQVFYKSKDGTQVPMFLVHRPDMPRDSNNPTYLFGYGGFDISLTPTFSPGRLVWLEMGGVFALPNLRGGGEYGRDWHEAGMKARKQNVFDDFLAAAEWLIDQKYTRPERLAISGRSNGGLLVGAALTQRPDLFGAALPGVGVMDMLRFHRFTIGWAWVSEYGSADNAADFDTLLAYSPLHNIKSGTRYPATLITTADHDDRVVPGHSFKFAATLQAAQAGPAPILIRIETSAGHGAGTPTAKLIEEAADGYAFLVQELKIAVPAAFEGAAQAAAPRPYAPATEQLVTEIFVRDLARSIDFYRRLGFQLVRQEHSFAELSWEGHLLFLDQRKGLPAVPSRPAANMRVMVPDVDRYWKLAAEMEARVVAKIGDRPYGLRDFTIADPDGYGVRFATELADLARERGNASRKAQP